MKFNYVNGFLAQERCYQTTEIELLLQYSLFIMISEGLAQFTRMINIVAYVHAKQQAYANINRHVYKACL